jgi:hypothetical protein
MKAFGVVGDSDKSSKLPYYLILPSYGYLYTGSVSESGDFATLFFLVRQHWGG